MPNSKRFKYLEVRLKQLERTFIPAIKVSGNYNKNELDQIRAFRLLAHAEIEAFLEDRAKSIMSKYFINWKNKNRASIVIMNLLCFSKVDKANSGNRTTPTVIHEAYLDFEKIIENNKGVKEHNLNAMYLPIGYKVDQTLLNTLNSFGKDRGNVAHTSAKTQQPIDPVSEVSTINLIMNELKKMDKTLINIK
jgi:hypothetical protein